MSTVEEVNVNDINTVEFGEPPVMIFDEFYDDFKEGKIPKERLEQYLIGHSPSSVPFDAKLS